MSNGKHEKLHCEPANIVGWLCWGYLVRLLGVLFSEVKYTVGGGAGKIQLIWKIKEFIENSQDWWVLSTKSTLRHRGPDFTWKTAFS